MIISEARIGTPVYSLVDFSAVPKGTRGIIDEDYGTGIMVAWNLPSHPLPNGYSIYDGKPVVATGILRDGFDKKTELQYLDVLVDGEFTSDEIAQLEHHYYTLPELEAACSE